MTLKVSVDFSDSAPTFPKAFLGKAVELGLAETDTDAGIVITEFLAATFTEQIILEPMKFVYLATHDAMPWPLLVGTNAKHFITKIHPEVSMQEQVDALPRDGWVAKYHTPLQALAGGAFQLLYMLLMALKEHGFLSDDGKVEL